MGSNKQGEAEKQSQETKNESPGGKNKKTPEVTTLTTKVRIGCPRVKHKDVLRRE